MADADNRASEIHLWLDADLKREIDDFRFAQPTIPTSPAAVRSLIRAGLKSVRVAGEPLLREPASRIVSPDRCRELWPNVSFSENPPVAGVEPPHGVYAGDQVEERAV